MREIKIDFDNPGLPQRLDVVENDAQSRFFKAVLYKDGKAYAAPSGATYSIMYRGFGPQNEGWYDTINDGAGKRAACSVSGNVVTCEIARQALRVPGHVSVVLCVTGSNGYMLHGWPIDCNCRNDNYTGGTSVESFFYITQITNADWTSAIQTWEELKNMIDPTLSISGKAADAAKVGEAVGSLKEDLGAEANRAQRNEESLENKKADKTDLDVERKRIDVLNDGGLNLKDDVIDTSIKTWLNDHPEATTTVQDGAITEGKISKTFLPYIKKDYVTPEMFGAIGDGVTDDTNAIQRAIDTGCVVLAAMSYKISETITIDVQNNLFLIGNFNYSKTDFAFWIHNSQEARRVIFGRITSNGSCIKLQPKNSEDYIQYLNIYFDNLIASTDNEGTCVYVQSNRRWANEINIFGGRFRKGIYGFRAICDVGEVEHIKLYNCGFELTRNGAYIENANAISLINCRYSENNHILTTSGNCINVNIYSSEYIDLEKLNLSSTTTGFITGPCISKTHDYSISKFSNIHRGKVLIIGVERYENLPNTEEVDFATIYKTARDLPTAINVNIKIKTVIFSYQYGVEAGINKIMVNANETSIRTLTIKKGDSVIAVFGKEIPDYSKIIMEWFPQYGWTYRIAIGCIT